MNPFTVHVPALASMRETRPLGTELKFLVTPAAAREIRAWARGELAADSHGSGAYADEYTITSLYYDTDALDVLHRRGSYGRAKYRVRRYGTTALAFLERKMRTKALLAKRRTAISLDDLEVLQEQEPVEGWAGAWFHDRIRARRLQPLVQVAYARMAREMTGPYGVVRLTVDDELKAVPSFDCEFLNAAGRPVLHDRAIVEIKYRRALPAKFRTLIDTHRLVPARISKYRLAQDALRPNAVPSPIRLVAGETLVFA